ncbi:hypothetical protein RCL_jg14221.t1 [Rhizophagus clarus]|uniref:Uncharacterized protein n=1 Tax=Rhizophagus clarus TaxID=94130 RepID=A0A8H3LL53_9GLOM|nr:hypothetical protein RCL_jg14221.t1 [Rhizophagus clarus]
MPYQYQTGGMEGDIEPIESIERISMQKFKMSFYISFHDWEYLLDCRGYNEAWNSIHDKLTIEFKLIGQKELKNDKTMPTRLNSAITELLGRQANSAKFREFVKLSMEVKCDRLCCPNHKRRGSQAATVQLSVTITQQNERRASILLQRGQPEIDYDGNGANVECYDDPFITLPVSPPLHTRALGRCQENIKVEEFILGSFKEATWYLEGSNYSIYSIIKPLITEIINKVKPDELNENIININIENLEDVFVWDEDQDN